ncbi:hypothetical protein [Paenibacillus shenyangensis]|uniref:hypothetical protein n=1 Tax=Paenibacillus sp. A9 TaxID=1284352 RepID=UPI00036CF65D|nr:hypothetical protein [Paenibacillus sp. A9]
MTKNPIDQFIATVKKLDEKEESFMPDMAAAIEKHLGDRYEGGQLERYLSDIFTSGYTPAEVKNYLIDLAKRVDRTDRGDTDG